MAAPSSIQHITDHAQRAVLRLLQQFRDGVTVPAFATVIGARAQTLEDTLWSILTRRYFSGNPTGQQLDNLGKIVNLPRGNMNDAAYTRFLQVQILLNRSSGSIPNLDAIFQIAGDPGSIVSVQEFFPANITVNVGGVAQTQPATLAVILQQAKTAGIRANLAYNTDTDSNSFTCDDLAGDGLGPGLGLEPLGAVLRLELGETAGATSARVSPITNWMIFPNPVSSAAWSNKSATGTGVVPTMTDGFAVDPSGGNGAERVQLSMGTNTSADSSLIEYPFVFTRFPSVFSAGLNCNFDIWLKTNDGTTKTLLMRGLDISNGTVITVAGSWQKFTLTTATNASTTGLRLWLKGAAGCSTSVDLLMWNPQHASTPIFPASGVIRVAAGCPLDVTLPYSSFTNGAFALLGGFSFINNYSQGEVVQTTVAPGGLLTGML